MTKARHLAGVEPQLRKILNGDTPLEFKDHLQLRGETGTKHPRLNSATFDETSGDIIGFQSKPGLGTTGTASLFGGQISPRLNDAVAAANIIGLHVDTYLKGDAGNVSGDVRGFQLEIVDDNAAGRTIGQVEGIRFRLNLSATVTNDLAVLQVDDEEGSRDWEFLARLPDNGTVASDAAESSATNAGWIAVKVGSSVRYINLFSGTPS